MEWIEHLLPGRSGSVGLTAADNRRFIEAVLFRYRAGILWRDLPERFGARKDHRRFSRRDRSGVWQRLCRPLAEDVDNECAMIDSTIVRGHQHSAGAQKKVGEVQVIGRSRGGLSTKIHSLVDALGYPIGFHPIGGQVHDLAGADHLLADLRAALARLGGRIFIGFGGHAGDCGAYHGVVLGVETAPPHLAAAWITRGMKRGVWSPGGGSVADGRVYFATGNTEPSRMASDWRDGIGAFRETPDLPHTTDPRDVFTPEDHARLDRLDLDLGGTVPVPVDLADGARRLVAMGKDGKAYLLDRDRLGGIGGALVVRRVARGPIITAPAVYRLDEETVVAFRAPRGICPDGREVTGVVALTVEARGLRPIWCHPVDGRGIPIVTTAGPAADPIVWVVGAEGDDRLHGFRGDTGEEVAAPAAVLAGTRHFVTPVVAAGQIYVAGDGRIYAFRWDESAGIERR